MSWDEVQAAGMGINYSEWNTMVPAIKSHWAITGMSDITWNSANWHNSSIGWDDTTQKWKPYKSGAGVGDGGISAWYDLDTGIGITAFGGAVAISGTQAETLSVADYIASSTAIKTFAGSSNLVTWKSNVTQSEMGYLDGVTSDIQTQIDAIVGTTANFVSGWVLASSTAVISHGYGSLPPVVGVSPSGSESFSYSLKVDATNLTVYLSASGQHCINWFAGGGEPGLYYPSSLGKGVSGAVLANTLHSANSALHSFSVDNYITSANALATFTDSSNVNWTKITAISSGFDGRLDTLEGYDEFDNELYITSSNSIGRFYPSALGKQVSSAVALNTTHRTSDGTDHTYIDQDITNASTPTFGGTNFTIIPQGALKSGSEYWGAHLSGQNINQDVKSGTAPIFTADNFSDGGSNAIVTTTQETNFTSAYTWMSNSGNKYSGWYGSGAQFATAYDHSQDNTQAHSDYLLNSGDDSTTGVLTAGGFKTTSGISGANISGAWTAPIYRDKGKPTAGIGYEGQIIMTSGGTGKGTWIYICAKNAADVYGWVQLGINN